MSKLLRMIILGAPGSGKGTISKRLVKDYFFKHISAGDVLRTHVMEKTDIGLEAEKYMKDGKLVPDEIMIDLIASELEDKESFLLDGFPRTIKQAKLLHDVQMIDVVLNLIVPHEVIIDRIKDRWIHAPSGRIYNTLFSPPKVPGLDDVTKEPLIQRDDDKPESVMKRLELYDSNMKDISLYYNLNNVLEQFHGTETNKIYPMIKEYMDSKCDGVIDIL